MRNKLAALMAKKDKVVIPAEKTRNGEVFELEVTGLTFPELTTFSTLAEKDKNEEAINLLLFSTLRKAIPTVELDKENGLSNEDIKEFIKNMDGFLASEIVKKVMELSGMDVKTPKKALEVAGREEIKQ